MTAGCYKQLAVEVVMLRVLSALVVASFVAGCVTVAEKKELKAQNERDRAACEKMCEVAGDAEDNTDAVAGCKKKCLTQP